MPSNRHGEAVVVWRETIHINVVVHWEPTLLAIILVLLVTVPYAEDAMGYSLQPPFP